jgi:hypothetical protein
LIYYSPVIFRMSPYYFRPSLVLLQTRCLLFVLVFLFVLAMTQVGTEAFCFLAFINRFFFEASLFLPKSLDPPNLELLLPRPLDGREQPLELLVVDSPPEPAG